ncbi:MAG TPA: penicillin-binding transpeptidase domain-containing protein [Candidatus Angelobacter sp.]|nr:penicillin-binding transpeptidase domain-containing protein [Candidatus Angelobacter sp.]
MKFRYRIAFLVVTAFVMALVSSVCFAASNSAAKEKKEGTVAKSAHKTVKRRARKHTASVHNRAVRRRRTTRRRRVARVRHRHHRYIEHFHTSSYATDITNGDETAGEDAMVRQAALDALGNMNGTMVAIDPTDGRILAMVNQKLALSEGAKPCSTIKIAVALAALSEGVISRETKVSLGPRWKMSLTQALAHSNNAYFEAVGRRLGFAKLSYYAHQFGLGELAGYHIEGEHRGVFPASEISAQRGGVGRMCSFGEGISMTPLQLGALVSAIANGGTLYYLQHPTSPDEVQNFRPRVKRELDIDGAIPEMQPGMMGAVEYGTARSLRVNFDEEQILGKTGTCSQDGTRFGWFTSYAKTQYGHIVTVLFLQGGRPTYGPKAAEITGKFYRELYNHNFFTATASNETPARATTVGAQQ